MQAMRSWVLSCDVLLVCELPQRELGPGGTAAMASLGITAPEKLEDFPHENERKT